MAINRKSAVLVALVISVAVNLFLLGAVGANVINRPERISVPAGISWMVRDLEPDARASLQPQLQSFGETIRPLRGQMFRAQREVNRLMAEEPLDREAVLAALDELRQANIHYQQLSHQQMVMLFSQLDVEQRRRALRFMSGRRNPVDGRPGGRPGETN
tara:strand:- start:59507 stop:59983 length:477 start_codon:yes stop_codon:yes gene_type:complete